MTSPLLVTGGTGTLGRLVVARLRDAGRDVRVLSRRPRPAVDGVRLLTGDLVTGEGLGPAVEDVATIVHCATDRRGDPDAARNLIRAAGSGNPHLVYISIVGVDRIPFFYYRSKLATERVVAESGLPWTILRTTQFHDLILAAARQLTKLPVVPVPAGFRFQPVDADAVAARLVELALGDPAGRVEDLGGPRVYGAAELIRGYLRAAGRRRAIVPVRLPGRTPRAFRAGYNLVPEHLVGRSWEDFLSARFEPSSRTRLPE